MERFTIPRDVYHGEKALEALKQLKGSKAFVVSGNKAMKENRTLKMVITYLKESGFETSQFEGVEPNPSVETAIKGSKKMLEFEPDWIIAVGGGSTIDAAKAMWAFYEYPDAKFEDLCVPFSFPTLRTKAKFCAVPSTSGTGSEVTAFSIISDYSSGIKYPLADFNITPDVAIVDASVVESMPPRLVAFTGMDALTHAVEAYVSTIYSDYTDAVALYAIGMIHKYLVKSYNGCMEARAKMHDASCLAGMAFSNALLGIVHSLAHKTGIAYSGSQIIHGCANAMYLPKVTKYNSKIPAAAERYAEIADYLKLGGTTTEEKVENLIEWFRGLNDQMKIPQAICYYGEGGAVSDKSVICEKEFIEKLSTVAENAIGDACTGSNPRNPSQEEIEQLLKACYYDADIDF